LHIIECSFNTIHTLLKNYITLIAICLLSVASYGQKKSFTSQEQDSLSIWQLAKYDGASAFGGLAHAYTRPLHWDGDDWATFGFVAGGTAMLYFLDDETSEFFINQEGSSPSVLKEFGERFGSPQVTYGITGSVYLFGLFTKNERVRETGVLLISSATAVGLIQTILKTTVGRSRPQNGEGKFAFKPFSGEAGFRSFPSGHTILSFTTAYAIAKQFDNAWVKAGIYTIGMIAPISRIVNGAHWLTDVALSIAISIATVDAIDNYLNGKNRYPDDRHQKGITWNINFGIGSMGIVGRF
jgi:hypothetical protein